MLHPSVAHVDGSYTNADDIHKIAERVDVLTVEIEHVDVQALSRIRDTYRMSGGHLGKGIEIFPSPETIAIVQDKLSQKRSLTNLDIPAAGFVDLPEPTKENVARTAETLGWPLLLKSRRQAYDGRGNFVLHSLAETQKALDTLRGPLYAEKYVPEIAREVVVVLVRNSAGEVRNYGVVENVHAGKIGHLVRAPLRHPDNHVSALAKSRAEKVVNSLPGGAVGVFGVEFFFLADGTYATGIE